MSEPLLAAQGVTRSFTSEQETIPVLRGVDLEVQRGERVAITGASGAGKSTLLHVLGGLDRPDAGRIDIAGRNLAELDADELAAFRNAHLGFVYQFHHLLREFSALENAAMPLLIAGTAPADARSRATAMLEAVGLGGRLTHRPAELSGGERQRVAFARALVMEPDLVLADEPTGNLDEATAERLHEEMLRLVRERGAGFIVVTHDSGLASRMDRRLTLHDGVLTASDG